LPARLVASFRQVAKKAAIARLYSSIHYRDVVENGQSQGANTGAFVLKKFTSFNKKDIATLTRSE
jgi:hypothetical protein